MRIVLLTIGHIELPYTWWNSRTNGDVIFERLERVVVDPQWINLFRDAQIQNWPNVGFDHGPILLLMDN